MNVCILKGNLTRDVELKQLPNGSHVATFGLAVQDRPYKTASGEWKQQVSFVNLELFDSGAKALAERYKKGDSILVNASVRSYSWTDAEGKKHNQTRFRVNHFEDVRRYEKEESPRAA